METSLVSPGYNLLNNVTVLAVFDKKTDNIESPSWYNAHMDKGFYE